MKVSPPHVKSVNSSLNLSTTISKSDSASHWLPTVAELIIMDPNQPKPLMKLPISIKQDSLQFHTSVLIDSATTLNFVSEDFLTRNNLLGKCSRGSKIVVRIAYEKRISTSKTFSPINVSISPKNFTGLKFTVLPHLKCVDFIFGLPAMKEWNMSIQPSNDLVLIGDMPFSRELQPRRVSCLLVDSDNMQKILAKAERT